MNDNVVSPRHYVGKTMIEETGRPVEVLDFIEVTCGFSSHLPQAIIYIARHHRKGRPLEDLDKALFYVRRVRKWAQPFGGMPSSALSHSWLQAETYKHEFDLCDDAAGAISDLLLAQRTYDMGAFRGLLDSAAAGVMRVRATVIAGRQRVGGGVGAFAPVDVDELVNA